MLAIAQERSLKMSLPDLRQRVPVERRSHEQIPRFLPGKRLIIASRRLEQLFKLGLILCRDEREPDVWYLGSRLLRPSALRLGR